MMNKITVLFFVSFVLSLSSVIACSCIPVGSVSDELNKSDYVFQGKVLKINSELLGYTKEITFEVESLWKGANNSKEIKVYTGQDSAMCGYNFEVGNEYLVYSVDTEEGLLTGLCSRTTSIEYASEDLAELGQPMKIVYEKKDSWFVSLKNWIFGIFN